MMEQVLCCFVPRQCIGDGSNGDCDTHDSMKTIKARVADEAAAAAGLSSQHAQSQESAIVAGCGAASSGDTSRLSLSCSLPTGTSWLASSGRSPLDALTSRELTDTANGVVNGRCMQSQSNTEQRHAQGQPHPKLALYARLSRSSTVADDRVSSPGVGANTMTPQPLLPLPQGQKTALWGSLKSRLSGKLSSFASQSHLAAAQSLPRSASVSSHSSMAATFNKTGSSNSVSSSWSRASSSGSLLGASVYRLSSQPLPEIDSAWVTNTQNDKTKPAVGRTVSEPVVGGAETVARQFGQAFIKALLGGHAAWGSWPEVGAAFTEDAVMVTHDDQVFSGRTAIIRRLNKGMEQFLKMLGVDAQSAQVSEELAAKAGKIETSFEFKLLKAAKQHAAKPGAAKQGANAADSGIVVATYTFAVGIRRFKLEDRFKIRQGKIVQLRRLR